MRVRGLYELESPRLMKLLIRPSSLVPWCLKFSFNENQNVNSYRIVTWRVSARCCSRVPILVRPLRENLLGHGKIGEAGTSWVRSPAYESGLWIRPMNPAYESGLWIRPLTEPNTDSTGSSQPRKSGDWTANHYPFPSRVGQRGPALIVRTLTEAMRSEGL
jgi:hypothetical protein